MFTWMSCVSHWSATASTPMRGKPNVGAVVPDPHVHRLAHLRIVGLRREHVLAVVAQAARQINRSLAASSSEPAVVDGAHALSAPSILRRAMYSANSGRTSSRSSPNVAGSGCVLGSRFSAFAAHQLPHPGLELVGDGLAEPRVQRPDLADRIRLHREEVDVVEAVVGAAVAELQRRGPCRPTSARRSAGPCTGGRDGR